MPQRNHDGIRCHWRWGAEIIPCACFTGSVHTFFRGFTCFVTIHIPGVDFARRWGVTGFAAVCGKERMMKYSEARFRGGGGVVRGMARHVLFCRGK